MPIRLRSELPGDEEAIDRINFLAFDAPRRGVGGGLEEVALVRRLRSQPGYDPVYSILALEGDEPVGHALFTPFRLRLMGRTAPALALGPLAVLPGRQRQGIGGELIRRGHSLGRLSGYEFAFLCGHPGYYPRHGYRPAFGFAKATIDLLRLPAPATALQPLPVCAADLPWLVACAEREWADVDFAIVPAARFWEWTIPAVMALIWWTEDGRRAAYTLATGNARAPEWQLVLADEPTLARDAICTIKPASLAHHPSGWLARNALDPAWSSVAVEESPAAMACELRGGTLEPYFEALKRGQRLPGACNWALPFLLC
jgi:putative acetyltransferase